MQTAHTSVIERSATTAHAGPDPADVALVADLLRSIGTALRNHRLYGGSPAVSSRFVEAVRKHLLAAWEIQPVLRLAIDESGILWEQQVVHAAGAEPGDLAFLFFKDGIRALTLLPGFEGDVDRFLEILARAPQLRSEEDDLVTLFWQADLAGLRYDHVELTADEVDLPVVSGAMGRPVPAESVRADAAAPGAGLRADDFRETLYFLDDAELRHLAAEVRREAERDLWHDVAAALFDRLEDGSPERQLRIVGILRELLAQSLASARFDRAAGLLGELARLAATPGGMPPEVLREVRSLYLQLADEAVIRQLVLVLEDAPDPRSGECLADILAFFPPAALAPLVRAAPAVTRPDVRRTLDTAIERLAASNRDQVVRLLAHAEPGIAEEAVRWAARLRVGAAVGDLVRMLDRPEASIRRATVLALEELGASVAGARLVERLGDPEREVRIAAARALSALEYTAAGPVLRAAIASKRLRSADRTEKIAFFEAYGRLGGVGGSAYLDRLLNGRSWLGTTDDPEIRACAALGLGRARHPAAREALARASADGDPVVRSAVARALRGEGS